MANRRFIKIHKNTINAKLNRGEIWEGLMVGNKVHPSNFIDNWCLAVPVSFKTREELESAIDSFNFYLDSNLGDRPAFYVIQSPIEGM